MATLVPIPSRDSVKTRASAAAMAAQRAAHVAVEARAAVRVAADAAGIAVAAIEVVAHARVYSTRRVAWRFACLLKLLACAG